MATFSRRRNAKDQIMCKIGMNLLRLQSSKRARTQYRVLCSTHQYAPLEYTIFHLIWNEQNLKWEIWYEPKMEWVRNGTRRRNAEIVMCKIGMNLLRLQSSKCARTQFRVLCSTHHFATSEYAIFHLIWNEQNLKQEIWNEQDMGWT